ncbi:MAG: glycosyltransferase family 4 protein [Chitinophagaceae bacterium]
MNLYSLIIIKRKIENVFIYPFILMGRFIALARPLHKEHETFFFFPFYHTGGAEKVHLQIAEAVSNKNSIIFFTRKSADKTFYQNFVQLNCTIKDISKFTDNKWLFFFNLIYRGIISTYINHQKNKPIVFNGQCNFAYKISPWIKKEIKQIELIHALNSFSLIRIPFLNYYTLSLTVSEEIINKHQIFYKKYQLPENIADKFSFVETKVDLPKKFTHKNFENIDLIVLYVGRGTEEKRVHLIGEVAKKICDIALPVKFILAGEVKNSMPLNLQKYCNFLGNVSDKSQLENIYQSSHILMVTSSTESGPLVTMEAMAYGLAIITTNVGFVSNYVINDENGYKINPQTKEDEIVNFMSEKIEFLYNHRELLKQMSEKNLLVAFENFGLNKFKHSYQDLFESLK